MKMSFLKLGVLLCMAGVAGASADRSPQVSGATLAAGARPDFGRVSLIATAIAGELANACPLAKPDDQTALENCKSRLYADSEIRRQLPEYVLWGRMRDPNLSLKETMLTQFGKDVFTAAYLPLFMFNGKYNVQFDEREKLYRIELSTAFRNRLAPGEFPYPFWHDENKWATYQGANRLTVWVGIDQKLGTERIRAMQFSTFGTNHAGTPSPIATPVFNKETHGKWLWTDASGKTQPQVTLFDGQYSANNPNLGRLDQTYRALAIELRNGECMTCHVPNNPEKMKRLVLMQTPAHAASEVGRIISAVRRDKMPLDDIGIEEPLPDALKQTLLEKAEAFDAAIKDAKKWELIASAKPAAPAKADKRVSPSGK